MGFTAVFIGYLTVWLPGPGVGLSFLGIEMGEWFKFLGLGGRRDIFYFPPISLSLMLAVWTITWPQNNWQAWAIRALAVLVSLLAFPAIEDITGPVREQYTLRVILIAMVAIVALLSGIWRPSARHFLDSMGCLGHIGHNRRIAADMDVSERARIRGSDYWRTNWCWFGRMVKWGGTSGNNGR